MDRIDRIRATWAIAAASPDATARAFYANLFKIAPETQPLFRADMQAQGRKLVDTLGFIVDHLDEEAALLSAARDLAERHVAYGVTPTHYAAVGAALVQTFEEGLGDAFGAEERAAWSETYTALADHMIASAYG